MSDRHYSGSYTRPYELNYQNYTYNQGRYDNQTGKNSKERNSYDIKESNISQQTIIHRARLYSPDKSQEFARYNFNNNQNWGKTKAKKSQITAKIHEIVDLCEDDRDAQIEQFKEVVEAQRKILDMLHESEVRQHQVPGIDLSHFGQGHQDRGTTFGPIRNQSYEVAKIQSKQGTRREVQVNDKNTVARQNIYKKSAIDDLKTDRNFLEEQSNLPAEIKQISQINKPLADQTQRMIDQIERKAMDEIESLRNDKIDLMRKLNQEIREHNEEKKLRIRLESQLARLRGEKVPQNRVSFPHGDHSQAQANAKAGKKYFSQPQKSRIPAQTYYPPPPSIPIQDYNQPYPETYPARQHPQQKQQNLSDYEKQIQRLQFDNNNLMKTLKIHGSQQNANLGRNTSNQNDELKYQVIQLKQLISQYQSEMGRQHVPEGMHGVSQLQNLLQQGERIQLEALRLLNRNSEQKGGRKVPTSQQIQEETNNFKRSLFASEANRQMQQIGAKGRNSSQNIAPTANFYSYRKQGPAESKRIQEFQRILNDMNIAAR